MYPQCYLTFGIGLDHLAKGVLSDFCIIKLTVLPFYRGLRNLLPTLEWKIFLVSFVSFLLRF